MRPTLLALLVAVTLSPSLAHAWPDLPNWPNIHVDGYLQPGFEVIKNDPLTQRDEQGFFLFRVHAIVYGEYVFSKVTFDARIEIEGSPQFSLFDAYVDAKGKLPGNGAWRIIVGQNKAPYSRQILVFDPQLQFAGIGTTGGGIGGGAVSSAGAAAGKSWLTEIAPGLQLGLTADLHVPYAPWLQLSAGVYNGDGRNTFENVDTNFMYVGRVAFRPFGAYAPYVESALGENQLSIAANVSYNVLNVGDSDQIQTIYGGDVFGCWKGLSGYGEALYATTTYAPHDPTKMLATTENNFKSIGYNAQGGYLLPLPGYLFQRFEVVGRFQGIIRNDTVALAQVGDANQAHYDIGAGLNYYQRGHSLKLMLNYHHFILPDDPNRNTKGAAYDAFFAQINFRLE